MIFWEITGSPVQFDVNKLNYVKKQLYNLGSTDDIQQLALDISINGQLKPIYIAEINGVLEVIDGIRRCDAIKSLLQTTIIGFLVKVKVEDIPFFQVSANMYRQKTTQEIIDDVLIVKSKILRHQGKKAEVISVCSQTKVDFLLDSVS